MRYATVSFRNRPKVLGPFPAVHDVVPTCVQALHDQRGIWATALMATPLTAEGPQHAGAAASSRTAPVGLIRNPERERVAPSRAAGSRATIEEVRGRRRGASRWEKSA